MATPVDGDGVNMEISDALSEIHNYFEDSLSIDDDKLLENISSNVKYVTSESIKSSNRDKFPDDGISVLTRAFKFANDDNNVVHIQLRSEIFRCLRNICSLGKHFQEIIARSHILIQISKDTVISVLERKNVETHYQQCLRCIIQFWGNLVVDNSVNKKLIWFEVKEIFRLLLQSDDAAVINYASMLLCNCLHDENEIIKDLFDDSDSFLYICNFVIDVASEKEVEWGLYTLLSLLKTDNLFRKLFKAVSGKQRLFLLEVTKLALDDKKDKVSQKNILFLADELKKDWSKVLSTSEVDLDQFELIALLKTLEVLCAASILDDYKEKLQEDLDLMSTILYVLKSVHMLGKQSNNNFTPIVKLSAVANPETVDQNPVNGMKRDLVRLIGNLSWKCKRNQDHVRELDGIALLLDCCNIDARNPFITQWVVFAVRNLCENNLENQNVIKSMEKLDSVDSNILSELNVKMTNEGGSTATPMRQNLDDIETLFG